LLVNSQPKVPVVARSKTSSQPFTIELMAADVLCLMDFLKIPKASLVGWSEGGGGALFLAIHIAARIEKFFVFGAKLERIQLPAEALEPGIQIHE